MKKNLFFCALIVMLAFVYAGCQPDSSSSNTSPPIDSDWLVGEWENAVTGTEFLINSDVSFRCDLFMIKDTREQPARVYGKLSRKMEGLGPNQYHLANMKGADAGDPDASYNSGNNALNSALKGYTRLVGTLAPANEEKTEFTFSSGNPGAQVFFGGTYTKKTQ